MSLGPGGSPHNTTAPGNVVTPAHISTSPATLLPHPTLVRQANSFLVGLAPGTTTTTTTTNSSSSGGGGSIARATAAAAQGRVDRYCRGSNHLLIIPLPPTLAGDPLHYALTGNVTVALQLLALDAMRCSNSNDANENPPSPSSTRGEYGGRGTPHDSRYGHYHHHHQRSASLVDSSSLSFAQLPMATMSSSVHGAFDNTTRIDNMYSTSALPDVVHGSPSSGAIPSFSIVQHARSRNPETPLFPDRATASFRLHPDRSVALVPQEGVTGSVLCDVGGAVFDETDVDKNDRATGQQLLASLEKDLRELEQLMMTRSPDTIDDAVTAKTDLDNSTSQVIMEEDYDNNSEADTVKSFDTNYSYDSLDDDSDEDNQPCEEDNEVAENSGDDDDNNNEEEEEASDYDKQSSSNDVFDSTSEIYFESSFLSISSASCCSGEKVASVSRPTLPSTLPKERRKRQKWQAISFEEGEGEEDSTGACASKSSSSSQNKDTSGCGKIIGHTTSDSGLAHSDSSHSDLQTPTNPPFFSVTSPTASEPPTTSFRVASDTSSYTGPGVLKKRCGRTKSTSAAVEKHCSFSIDNSPTTPIPQSTPSTPSTPTCSEYPSSDNLVSLRHHQMTRSFCDSSYKWTSDHHSQYPENNNNNNSDTFRQHAPLRAVATTSLCCGSSYSVQGSIKAVAAPHRASLLHSNVPHHSSSPDFSQLPDAPSCSPHVVIPGRAHRILLAKKLTIDQVLPSRRKIYYVSPLLPRPASCCSMCEASSRPNSCKCLFCLFTWVDFLDVE